MGKNGASRNYTNRTYAENSKIRTRIYQDPKYGQNLIGQRNESTRTTRSSRLLKAAVSK